MSDDELIDELVVAWEDAFDRSHDPDPAALCRSRPDLLVRVAAEVNKPRRMRGIASPTATTLPPDTPAAAAGGATDPSGRFRPLHLHARGGLGEVYVARDTELGRELALKRMQDRWAGNRDSRDRFRREAWVTARRVGRGNRVVVRPEALGPRVPAGQVE
jgi:hypothetical protein